MTCPFIRRRGQFTHDTGLDHNLPQDNAEASRLLKALIERTNLTGYAEVTHYAKRRTLYDEFLPLASPAFRLVRLQDKSDLYGALRHFFSERTA
ncbi:DUF444 family protein [Hydrogenibacillus schlegelii]|uniref:DUF444 family protein n=1 Tax=Hydrogenibacillus schlegelii TaxID=1484 RepID=UPI0034A065D9